MPRKVFKVLGGQGRKPECTLGEVDVFIALQLYTLKGRMEYQNEHLGILEHRRDRVQPIRAGVNT